MKSKGKVTEMDGWMETPLWDGLLTKALLGDGKSGCGGGAKRGRARDGMVGIEWGNWV